MLRCCCIILLQLCIAVVAAQAQIPTTQLTLWLKADAGVVKDASNNVSEWQDQSGNGFHLTQTTLSKQPKFTENILNTKPVLRFNGDYMQLTFGESFSQPNSIFIVMKFNSLQNNQYVASGSYSFHVVSSETGTYFRAGAPYPSGLKYFPTLPSTNFFVSSLIANSGSSSILENGLLKSSGNAG